MKNKTNLKLVLIVIATLVIILAIGTFTGINYFDNNLEKNKTNLYENIGIKDTELNILFLNIGQR